MYTILQVAHVWSTPVLSHVSPLADTDKDPAESTTGAGLFNAHMEKLLSPLFTYIVLNVFVIQS